MGEKIYTSGNYRIKLVWSDTYYQGTNTSTIGVSIAAMSVNGSYNRTWYISGIVKVNGTAVLTMRASTPATYKCNIAAKNVWYDVTDMNGVQALGILYDVPHNEDGSCNITIELCKNSGAGSNSYFYFYNADGKSFYIGEQSEIIALEKRNRGLVRIYNGTSWGTATVHIYDGSQWKLCIPYVYNGSSWKLVT